jgi:hypothetical protein
VGHRGLYSKLHYVFISRIFKRNGSERGLRWTSSRKRIAHEKLTNSTVDCDIALLEKEEKEENAGRKRGRVQKRNIQQSESARHKKSN